MYKVVRNSKSVNTSIQKGLGIRIIGIRPPVWHRDDWGQFSVIVGNKTYPDLRLTQVDGECTVAPWPGRHVPQWVVRSPQVREAAVRAFIKYKTHTED